MTQKALGMIETRDLVASIEAIYEKCGVAHTDVFKWLEDDDLLTLENINKINTYALEHMEEIKVIEDCRGYWHILNKYDEIEDFCVSENLVTRKASNNPLFIRVYESF